MHYEIPFSQQLSEGGILTPIVIDKETEVQNEATCLGVPS